MMIRAIFTTLAIAIMGLTSPLLSSRALAASPVVRLEGMVTDQAGAPLRAFVTVGTTVQSNTQGHYSIPVQPSQHLAATLWAPGYQQEHIQIQLPSSTVAGENVVFNFSGHFALASAFVNREAGARLLGLPIKVAAARHIVEIHGSTRVALESQIAVTLPDGRVTTYPLTRRGASFAARLPLEGKGLYRVEVNAISGFAVFNVPVFHGVRPFVPADPITATDPSHASRQQLEAFALRLINHARRGAGLAPLHMLSFLTRTAAGHDADMVAHGYFLEHPHIGANGSTPWQRVTKLDRNVREVGETVGEAGTIGQAVAALLDSPEHRAILLGNFQGAGVAITPVAAGWLMTIDFTR